MDSVSELRELSDDEVTSLLKIVCRPGGTIPNLAIAVAAAPGGPELGPNAPLEIPNPGLT
eukprot:CAMPEP_0202469936 /NCGR_PEP_ID=MMETSP1360-20130828/80049_1 /ASSEMBLY_ACC=CAM_ASM_000848 /TAXON_ID=515479 /ORGANISM="Licmophora paradoxa, Strain CCMP2313" /LENGTH=59 /DNA_ID=CAMNT_0049095451 /DNA_START=17 /DNA_END=193 /DNA_ORIENTATION=+